MFQAKRLMSGSAAGAYVAIFIWRVARLLRPHAELLHVEWFGRSASASNSAFSAAALGSDCPDLQFAAKEASGWMAKSS